MCKGREYGVTGREECLRQIKHLPQSPFTGHFFLANNICTLLSISLIFPRVKPSVCAEETPFHVWIRILCTRILCEEGGGKGSQEGRGPQTDEPAAKSLYRSIFLDNDNCIAISLIFLRATPSVCAEEACGAGGDVWCEPWRGVQYAVQPGAARQQGPPPPDYRHLRPPSPPAQGRQGRNNKFLQQRCGSSLFCSVADPWHFGIWIRIRGSIPLTNGSGSFYHQAKILRKPWFLLFCMTFYLWKMM